MDPYIDSILGDWSFDRSGTTKTSYCYKREAKVTLHCDHAQPYFDPETHKKYKVFGEVILKETKLIDRANSNTSLFRGIELTPRSELQDVID